jgi:hypothetical protein
MMPSEVKSFDSLRKRMLGAQRGRQLTLDTEMLQEIVRQQLTPRHVRFVPHRPTKRKHTRWLSLSNDCYASGRSSEEFGNALSISRGLHAIALN